MSTILFPGRFDKVHSGHIITIQRLAKTFDSVIVCVLDYPGSRFELSMRLNVLSEALFNSKGNYLVISNKIHFAKITHKRIREVESLLNSRPRTCLNFKTPSEVILSQSVTLAN